MNNETLKETSKVSLLEEMTKKAQEALEMRRLEIENSKIIKNEEEIDG